MDSPKLNIVGLCSGVGMLETAVKLGCEYLGWRTRLALCCEWEAYTAACLLARMEESSLEPAPIWCGDLRDFDGQPFRGLVDILCAGLPCQPYSCAGKRQGWSDQRSYGDGDGPIPHFLRIVAECRPSVVFIENVPPWFTAGWFRPFGEELCRLGYTLETPLFLTAEAVGASHRRERAFGLADSMRTRSQGSERRITDAQCEAVERSGQSIFAPSPTAEWTRIPEYLWPATEPGFRLLVDGLAVVLDESRTDQLRCGGNGVVALSAAVAFVELMRRACLKNKQPNLTESGI